MTLVKQKDRTGESGEGDHVYIYIYHMYLICISYVHAAAAAQPYACEPDMLRLAVPVTPQSLELFREFALAALTSHSNPGIEQQLDQSPRGLPTSTVELTEG